MVPHAKSGFWRGLAPYLLSSILLISAYMHVGAVKVAASSLAVIGIPIHFVASLPSMTLAAMQGRLITTDQLRRQFEFLREQNLILRTLIEKSGYRLPVTDVKVRYVGSLTYGDRVNIRAWITENRSRTITFNYEIRSSANSAILVSGSTSHAWTNLEGKVTRAPSVWLNL